MVYSIIYDAVRKKAATVPPNVLIGNVEMAAGIGMILKEIGETLDYNEIHTPEELREVFLKLIDERGEDGISELMKNTLQEIRKYEVRPLVNEKMDNLYDLCQMKL